MLTKKVRSRAQKVWAFVALAALTLTGCSAPADTSETGSGVEGRLTDLGLAGKNAKQVIERLDTMPVEDRPTDFFASVLQDSVELTFIDESNGEEDTTSLPLPEDEFYVSIAPFVQNTHACFYHSLTTCLGEMSRETLRVKVTDTQTAEVVFDKGIEAYDNGFFGLWLPRGSEYEVAVESDLGDGVLTLGTGEEDPTCVTTLQLDSQAEALGAI